MGRNKVALIIPYFGQWPEWFELYLLSVAHNPLDVFFFTDCEIPSEVPDNVHITQITFEDYCTLVSGRLGFTFRPNDTYKLCDLKPFYGIIHQDIVSEYEFWGFGDIDLIYGDMSLLLSPQLLARYDFVSTHSDRVSGHFAIMRTKSRYTSKCLDIPDWKSKLADSAHRNVDEADFTFEVYPEIRFAYKCYQAVRRIIRTTEMNSFLDKMNIPFCNRITKRIFKEYHTTPVPQKGQVWAWSPKTKQIIAPDGTAIPYLHFLFFKENRYKHLQSHWNECEAKDHDYRIGTVNLSLSGIEVTGL